MPSWQQVLLRIADAYRERREEILQSSTEMMREIRAVGLGEFSPLGLSLDQLDSAFVSFTKTFDATNGGFGGAPKFPPPMALEFLLRYYHRTGEEKALQMVVKTCVEMARGGIYDQLGGGFHRYTVDAVWLVPHFEKMLYDNAQLARIYLHVWQITKDEFFKRIAEETLEYVRREMRGEGGGFFSTQDADSEGAEGKFFVWEKSEILKILGDEAEVFCAYYGVTEEGNFEERNILNVVTSLNDLAAKYGKSNEDVVKLLADAREKLFAVREKRIKPFRDEKILTAWNGMMLATFSEASAILAREDFLSIAKENADFLLTNLRIEGRLLRTWKDGIGKLNAYLEDYTNLCDGLLELFQVSGEMRWLNEAKRLADEMIVKFWDEESGGFYFTSIDHEELLMRSKDYYDNATPSGNSVAADVFLKLTKITSDEKYERYAVTILRLIATQIRRYAGAFGRALASLEFHLGASKEIVLIGARRSELEREVFANYLPGKITVLSGEASSELPLLEGRLMLKEKPTAYVCENFVCQKPTANVEELRSQLQIESSAGAK